MNNLSVAVQAGGESTRMGSNKALMLFLDKPLIQRVLQRVLSISQDVFVITNHPQDLSPLRVRLVTDEIPGKGAIGGLYTAMLHAKCEFVAVVACDMPFISPGILAEGLDLLIHHNADVAIPRSEKGYEPLHAVYRCESCLRAIKAAIDQEQRRLISWFDSVKVIELDQVICERYDPYRMAFINTNTTEEFEKAEQIARRLDEKNPTSF